MFRYRLVLLAMLLALAPSGAGATDPDKAAARIVISQDDQRLSIYVGAELVRQLPISTGWPGARVTTTPPWSGAVGRYWGTFASFGTTQDFGYWLYTDYLPDGSWNGDILIHGAPYVGGPSGEKVYARAHIGVSPASHGCIQLLPEDAAWFRAWDPQGVPVTIEPFARRALDYPGPGLGARLIGDLSAMGAIAAPPGLPR